MKEYGRYLIGILLLIVAIVLIVAGFNFIRNIIGGEPEEELPNQNKRIHLREAPSNNQAVQFTQIGRIVGKDQHYEVRITVNNDERSVELIEGYNGQVIKSARHDNTREAYEAFAAALNGAGYTLQLPPAERGNEHESCPEGFRYIYEVEPAANDNFRTWSNSCSARQGTFGGEAELVRQLFQKQIPDYNRFIADARIRL